MKNLQRNLVVILIAFAIICFYGQKSVMAEALEDASLYTIWAVDDQDCNLYYYILNENISNPDNMTPLLEGEIQGIDGQKDIEAFTIDSSGTMYLINNWRGQTLRESTLYSIDPSQVDGDENTPVVAVKIGPTGLRAESNHELTNLQFVNVDGQVKLYGITKRMRRIYTVDIRNGQADFVTNIDTAGTGFSRTDALTQGNDGIVYVNETSQDKIYRFESFPFGSLVEVVTLSGAGKIEALTAHPNGYLYAGDGNHWYKIWPDAPDNISPTWEEELNFPFGTEGMDFWFDLEKIKMDDRDGDGIPNDLEDTNQNGIVDPGESNPDDTDSDNDGILDNMEDVNLNGLVDANETDPSNADTDGDGVQDGTEMGYTVDMVGPDTNIAMFFADMDVSTTTDPLICNADGDGLLDGQEDENKNGRVDEGETDPLVAEHVLANDSLAVDFGNAGLYRYDNIHQWTRLTTYNPENSMVAVDIDLDGQTEAVINMLEGIFIAKECTFPRLTTSVAEEIIEFNNGLVVDFGSASGTSGIYQYNFETGWTRLTTSSPFNMFTSDLNKDGEDELIVTASNGLYYWDGNTWTQLSTTIPENVVEYDGGLAIDFGETGLHGYNLTDGWTLLSSSNPIDMTAVDMNQDGLDELALGFDNGVYILDPQGVWTRLTTSTMLEITTFNNGLIVHFASAIGIYEYHEATGWNRPTTNYPDFMCQADLDQNGASELYGIFPSASGLFAWDGNSWSRLTTTLCEDLISY